MDDRKQQLKLSNRGLTLVELIAAIAIIGIFGAVIASFITSGMNFYRHASDTSTVQRSMQNTLESIENLVIDTNGTIQYQVGGIRIDNDMGQEDQVKKMLVMKSISEDSSGTEKEVVDVLRWIPDEKKLYYIRNPKNQETTYEEVLAENVAGFNADISKAETDGAVRFRLTITKRGETVSQTYTVALRNKIKKEP